MKNIQFSVAEVFIFILRVVAKTHFNDNFSKEQLALSKVNRLKAIYNPNAFYI